MDERKVKNRNTEFSAKISSRFWQEVPNDDNPYIADNYRCQGYDLTQLAEKRSFTETLYLLFRGELPNQQQNEILQKLMIAFINPGPRHPASRAAMLAGVSKAAPSQLLPISLSILSGEHLGAGSLEKNVRFFRKNVAKDPKEIIADLHLQLSNPSPSNWEPIPGFGMRFGSIDQFSKKIAELLLPLPGAGRALKWGALLSEHLQEFNLGWLPTGVTAAVLSDLGFHPKAAVGIFQLISAPGLLAHGLEMSGKPLTTMPFLEDKDYRIEE
ncbi:citrate synthase [Desulfuromusa kysingii]|uniref:Citrate synthase n=1 Tax=Desulfuromusa kysingii TaxID=37625 RepID=A0A1H3YL37_9BACT|nr:citrate/2-methylcitrate synthase [Desulfuromusa kysingii]SEA11672.1 citrate synthase [Desulfuromusa kysingii]